MVTGITELVMIIDKSGSMSGLETDTIAGYNTMLRQQQTLDSVCKLTTVLFNHNYQLLQDGIDVQSVNPLTDRDYHATGTTALLDALGMTLQRMIHKQRTLAEADRADKVLFVIITDGAENASHEYSKQDVKRMIDVQRLEFEWEFIFLGANLDAINVAEEYGIESDRSFDYLADSEGTELNFKVLNETVGSLRQEGELRLDAMEAIRVDVENRKINERDFDYNQ